MGIKYQVDESFFKAWNPDMAYILGYLYADGSLENAPYLRGKYVRVTSTDKSTIVKIRSLLKSEHSIVEMKQNWPNGKLRYLLRIGSHKLYDALIRLGLYPNKSLTVQFPKVPRKYLRDFVRGYFDGDGCVMCEMAQGITRERIVKRLRIIFTSGSTAFLEGLLLSLKNTVRVHGDIYKNSRAFQLKYSTSESITLFKFMYANTLRNDYLVRKFEIFKNYFRLRPERIDKEMVRIFGREMAMW